METKEMLITTGITGSGRSLQECYILPVLPFNNRDRKIGPQSLWRRCVYRVTDIPLEITDKQVAKALDDSCIFHSSQEYSETHLEECFTISFNELAPGRVIWKGPRPVKNV
jgi:hypothetical protein